MRRLLVPAMLAGVLAPCSVAMAAEPDWQDASLVPIQRLARPRYPGLVPDEGAQPAAVEPVQEPMTLPTVEPEDDDGGDVVKPRVDVGAFLPIPPAGAMLGRPALQLGASLWQRRWGLQARTEAFGHAEVAGKPYFAENTFISDVRLGYRTVDDPLAGAGPQDPVKGHHELWLGYRAIGLADVNFATLGWCGVWPLGLRDLAIRASLLGGLATNGMLNADASLTLSMRQRGLQADLGLRNLYLAGGSLPALDLWGPVAMMGLAF